MMCMPFYWDGLEEEKKGLLSKRESRTEYQIHTINFYGMARRGKITREADWELDRAIYHNTNEIDSWHELLNRC